MTEVRAGPLLRNPLWLLHNKNHPWLACKMFLMWTVEEKEDIDETESQMVTLDYIHLLFSLNPLYIGRSFEGNNGLTMKPTT